MTTGEKLKKLRVKSNKTLKEQGELLGVSLNTVYRWEHNLATPRKSTLKKIADCYQSAPERLYVENDGEDSFGSDSFIEFTEGEEEKQLAAMFRKLSTGNKYRVLGYVEYLYLEETVQKHGIRQAARTNP